MNIEQLTDQIDIFSADNDQENNNVWNYLQQNREGERLRYRDIQYAPWIREKIREKYLPYIIDDRFSGRVPEHGPNGDHSEPQPFQREIFWYLIETSISRFGRLSRLRTEDVTLDQETQMQLEGIYNGVRSSTAILDHIQTPHRSRIYNLFPIVSTSTINAALHDESNHDFLRYSTSARVVESTPCPELVKATRNRIALQVGAVCAGVYEDMVHLSKSCNKSEFVGSAVVTTQLIFEQLAIQSYQQTW